MDELMMLLHDIRMMGVMDADNCDQRYLDGYDAAVAEFTEMVNEAIDRAEREAS